MDVLEDGSRSTSLCDTSLDRLGDYEAIGVRLEIWSDALHASMEELRYVRLAMWPYME